MAPNPVPLSPRRLAASGIRLRPTESAFREGSATIVMPTSNSAFFNPVQEFNRDLSVLAIKTWSETTNDDLKLKWEAKVARKAKASAAAAAAKNGNGKLMRDGEENGESSKRVKIDENTSASTSASTSDATSSTTIEGAENAQGTVFRPHKFTLLEALSATGLRSIRYAREIPLLKYVVANDLSAGAIKAMKRNIALNFPADRPIQEWVPEDDGKDGETDMAEEDEDSARNGAVPEAPPTADGTATEEKEDVAIHPECRIRCNEGDALDVMYSHRKPSKRFDVVDLDPYGTAAPFIDGAVQSVADGGLLCVTCTDSAVLASNSYPEKAFALYGGSSTRAEYSHEMGLRLVLHLISSTAAKYGRYIEPQLSLSIDFYVRLFIKVHSGPSKVKNLASQTGIVYTCSYCADFHSQTLGRAIKTEGRNSTEHVRYQNGSGPPPDLGSKCSQCGSNYLIAGPMWLDPIHNPTFCKRLLSILEREPAKSKTAPRIRGMVGLAVEELRDSLFYFAPAKVAGLMNTSVPSFLETTTALLNAGYQVSRSHGIPGSVKTNAPRRKIFDMMRCWIAQFSPVKMENVKDGSPARVMLAKEVNEDEFNFRKIRNEKGGGAYHPLALQMAGRGQGEDRKSKPRTTRYQEHPTANWGPGRAAPMK